MAGVIIKAAEVIRRFSVKKFVEGVGYSVLSNRHVWMLTHSTPHYSHPLGLSEER
jgi:hypothetical protein